MRLANEGATKNGICIKVLFIFVVDGLTRKWQFIAINGGKCGCGDNRAYFYRFSRFCYV